MDIVSNVWEKPVHVENWVKKRYIVLEKAFGSRPFMLSEAEEALRKAGIETGSVKELLSILQNMVLSVWRSMLSTIGIVSTGL